MLQFFKQLHGVAESQNPELAPQDSSFMLLFVIDLGLEYGSKTYEPIQSKVAALHKIHSRTTKIELMRLIGSMNFYSNFFGIFHVNMKPLLDLFIDIAELVWNFELETLFQQNKTFISKNVNLF